MIRIQCSAADAYLLQTETLTAGMVNLPVVQFEFSSDWDGLGKTAVVRAGTVIEELLVVDDEITVPASCMNEAGVNLIIGVWGGNASVELPTVWCACGEILDGTDPSSATNHTEASTSEVAQMLGYAEAIESYARTLDGSVIRSVATDTTDADSYGQVQIVVQDSGVGTNRRLTFKFVNMKGVGIDSVTFQPDGEDRGLVQVRLENGDVTNYEGIKDALDAMDDYQAALAIAEAARAQAEQTRMGNEVARAQTFAGWGSIVTQAEAWAVGKRNGVDVESTDPTFHNNAQYYAEYAEDQKDLSLVARQTAEAKAIDSEAWAVGQREGVDVGQTDETFHNNSKYYADKAEQGAAAAGYMDLYINDNGHLIYTRTDNVDNDFNIDSNGHLIWVNGTEEEEP